MRIKATIPLIIRNVKIEGPRGFITANLMLDTGAAFTTLSSSVLQLAGYDLRQAHESLDVITANGIIRVPKLIVEAISFEDCHSRNVDVICHDMPQLVEVHGLLGLSYLKSFKTVIDYREGFLEIT
jgi:clan AA aspartic protease (TIGR02281 family)